MISAGRMVSPKGSALVKQAEQGTITLSNATACARDRPREHF